MAKFKKGDPRPAGAGRKKGQVATLTKTVKEAFEIAFNALQNDKEVRLDIWGKENPTEFYKLASKLIPADVNATLKATVQVNVVDFSSLKDE
jgi:hypothetical protein